MEPGGGSSGLAVARYLAGIELRRRWRSAVALGLAAALAGALVLSAAAAARRGPDALDRFVAFHRLADVLVLVFDGPADIEEVHNEVRADPDVLRADAGAFVLAAFTDDEGVAAADGLGGVVRITGAPEVERPFVLAGRLPDPDEPFEVAVNEAFSHDRGLGIGDEVRLAVFSNEQTDRFGAAEVEPAHGVETFTVVGITRTPNDLIFENQAQPGTVYASEAEEVTWSPGFWHRYDGDIAGYGTAVLVQLRPGSDLDGVLGRIDERFPERVQLEDSSDSLRELAQVRQSVAQQSNGLWAFTAVLGITVVVLLVQALRRQVAGGLLGDPTLPALGPTASDLRVAAVLWAAPVAVAGAVVAIALAAAASAVGPVGIARRAELDTGFRPDPLVLAAGGSLLLLALLVAAALPFRPATVRAAARPPRFAGIARGPVGVAALALTSRLGASRSGARTSLVALPLAVAAVAGATVFGASLDRATTDPAAYGWSWDLAAGNCSQPACAESAAAFLDASPDIEAWTGLNIGGAKVAGIDDEVELDLVELGTGWTGGRILEGRPVAADDEALLGVATAAAIDAQVGEAIEVSIEGDSSAPFTVVGIVEPPALFLDDQALDEGLVLSEAGVLRALPPDLVEEFRENVVSQYFLIDVADDVALADAERRLQAEFPASVLGPFRPDRLEAAFQLRDLPTLLAAIVGLLGLAALLHVAAVGVLARRETFATFAALGCTARQRRRIAAATLVAVVGVALVVGLPAGIALGRIGWDRAADALGSSALAVYPPVGLLAVAGLVVVVAVLAGTATGVAVTRRSSSEALRPTR